MSIEYPPHRKPAGFAAIRGVEHAGNVVPLHEDIAVLPADKPQHRGDEFFAALSPLLEEAAGLQGVQSPYRETNDFLLLLEENARLRKLAIQLSNLLGDLPERRACAGSSRGRGRLALVRDQSKSP